ncbi:hypothetical protein C8R46DRAFT_1031426 [Mycena filopes]|nr:hypothetical protein C8R46DRAFT_1031426 [Mycena filopes]
MQKDLVRFWEIERSLFLARMVQTNVNLVAEVAQSDGIRESETVHDTGPPLPPPQTRPPDNLAQGTNTVQNFKSLSGKTNHNHNHTNPSRLNTRSNAVRHVSLGENKFGFPLAALAVLAPFKPADARVLHSIRGKTCKVDYTHQSGLGILRSCHRGPRLLDRSGIKINEPHKSDSDGSNSYITAVCLGFSAPDSEIYAEIQPHLIELPNLYCSCWCMMHLRTVCQRIHKLRVSNGRNAERLPSIPASAGTASYTLSIPSPIVAMRPLTSPAGSDASLPTISQRGYTSAPVRFGDRTYHEEELFFLCCHGLSFILLAYGAHLPQIGSICRPRGLDAEGPRSIRGQDIWIWRGIFWGVLQTLPGGKLVLEFWVGIRAMYSTQEQDIVPVVVTSGQLFPE